MIKIHEAIEYLREKLPAFRVDGAAEFVSAKDDSRLMVEPGRKVQPTLFLMLGSFTAIDVSKDSTTQLYDERIVVIACLDNTSDRTGNNAQQRVYFLRLALWSALLSYRGLDTDAQGIRYVQDIMVDQDRARYWHKFEFSIKGEIDANDGVSFDLDIFNRYVADWMSQETTTENPLATDDIRELYYR